MKYRIKKILLIVFIAIPMLLTGEEYKPFDDELPSERYYNENMNTPGTRGIDDLDPGGEEDDDGGFVGSPIGDAVVPILVAGVLYIMAILYKKSFSGIRRIK